MKHLAFSIQIDTSAEKVYNTLIHPDHALEWVRIFSAESTYEGSWGKGDQITFMTNDENGKACGLRYIVEENIPNELIILQPYSILEDGKYYTDPEKMNGLEKTSEKYMINQQGSKSELKIEAVVVDEQVEFFLETWPIALKKIKVMCEEK